MAINADLLKAIWARKKEIEFSTHGVSSGQDNNWSKLLYFTFGALSDYLVSTDENDQFSTRLQFSAKYFELLPAINDESNPLSGDNELMLFGAAAYFFADYPGAANVALKPIIVSELSLFEEVLYDVISSDLTFSNETFRSIPSILNKILLGYQLEDSINKDLKDFVDQAYTTGTDEDILAAECVTAVIQRKIKNSTLKLMPRMSGSSIDYWKNIIQNRKVEQTLWASQRALGEQGVFDGKSSVIQMPTGAGKTASISLILRSALSKKQIELTIIVAPFKSIRDEIFQKQVSNFRDEPILVNKLSDDLKLDFDFLLEQEKPRILIVTPEKLLFMIRHSPDLLLKTGLIIFDEAHQLDNADRGITFELLLATIRQLASEETQKIFISAVVGNPGTVSEWFNAGNNVKITGIQQKRYSKAYGVARWDKASESGQLFLTTDIDSTKKWVRYNNVVNPVRVNKQNIEPDFSRKDLTKSYRWLTVLFAERFVSNGMVAVFSPRKDTLSAIATVFTKYTKINDEFRSSLMLDSDTGAIVNLFRYNFGEESKLVKAFQVGVFIHDGEVPNSIRNSLEYAIQHRSIRLLLCTTTLAQGVNLPIKTMLITSVGQGSLHLKNRDLQNLIGRVGRSGIENEGNIIFVQGKSTSTNNNTIEAIKQILNKTPAEDLGSSLLNLFHPTPLDNYNPWSDKVTSDQWFTNDFLEDSEKWISINISNKDAKRIEIYRRKGQAIAKIENFLMSLWDVIQMGDPDDNLKAIVRNTYAYYISDSEEERVELENLFDLLYDKISRLVVLENDIQVYSRMLTGVNEALFIKKWIFENGDNILNSDDVKQMVTELWPLLKKNLNDKEMRHNDLYLEILKGWVTGESYKDLLNIWKQFDDVKIKNKKPNVETIYCICDQMFQYNMSAKISAIAELVEDDTKKKRLYMLHTAMKSGLPTLTENSVYSIGINDRYLSSQIAILIRNANFTEKQVKRWIRQYKEEIIQNEANNLPKFFLEIINRI
ncbi:DEAD/DEAH box helicase [Paucilactobacillus kaifaensis]|uniref:DEAD/DEAH box helicase n=1 Tax=Paucilactobacillus kaifaensis TaxID=2559921 RepID=UPI0010F7D069|nr:DEAD/DEAH box helicase [Paucilactobacillus kaifaensis]